jgi:parallel beta-helix repeat protein
VFVRSNSTNATIRNCVINNGGSAEEWHTDSSDATIFNNLIFDNGRGVVISGSPAARVINNTIVNNRNFGISFDGASAENVASTDGNVLNNIVQASRSTINLQVDDGPPSALPGYVGDFNLVFAPTLGDQQQRTYRPTFLQAEHDVNEDAQFVNFAGDDFHLAETSPARDAGTSEIDDDLRNELFDRTTSSDDALDSAPPDLGYHFPVLDQQ